MDFWFQEFILLFNKQLIYAWTIDEPEANLLFYRSKGVLKENDVEQNFGSLE